MCSADNTWKGKEIVCDQKNFHSSAYQKTLKPVSFFLVYLFIYLFIYLLGSLRSIHLKIVLLSFKINK